MESLAAKAVAGAGRWDKRFQDEMWAQNFCLDYLKQAGWLPITPARMPSTRWMAWMSTWRRKPRLPAPVRDDVANQFCCHQSGRY